MTRFIPEQTPSALRAIPRAADLNAAARMPLADPLWMLLAQVRMGEFEGLDMGTPAMIRVEGESNRLTATRAPDGGIGTYDPMLAPLEPRAEGDASAKFSAWGPEPLALSREIKRILRAAGLTAETRAAFVRAFPLPPPDVDPAVEPALSTIELHVAGRVPNGMLVMDSMTNSDVVVRAALADGGATLDQVDAVMVGLGTLFRRLGAHGPGLGTGGGRTWSDATLDHGLDALAPTGAVNAADNPVLALQPDERAALADALRGTLIPDFGDLREVELEAVLNPQTGLAAGVISAAHSAGLTLRLPDRVQADVLRLSGLSGGPLEWWDADLAPAERRPADDVGGPAAPLDRVAIPTAVSYPGMPLPRLWSVEDPGAQYGHLDPAPEDLARLVVAQFALGGARDWMTVPLALAAGSLTRLGRVTLRDVFGRDWAVDLPVPGPDDPFCIGGLTRTVGGVDPVLYVPPVLPAHLRGAPVERVDISRDPGANLVWAAEVRAPDATTGLSVDRVEQEAAKPVPATPDRAPVDATMAYDIATRVAANLFPLDMPPEPDPSAPRQLVRAALLDAARDAPAVPSGAILSGMGAVDDESVPPTGLRLERSDLRTRWVGGRVQEWTARRRSPRLPDRVASGLRFDGLEPLGGFARANPVPGGRVSLRDALSYIDGPPEAGRLTSAAGTDPGSGIRAALAALALRRD